MKRAVLVFLTLLLTLFTLTAVIACGTDAASDELPTVINREPSDSYEEWTTDESLGLTRSSTSFSYSESVEDEVSAGAAQESDAVRTRAETDSDRMLIFSANASLETKNFDKSRFEIEAALAAAGGHTQDSELRGDGTEGSLRFYSAVLRVPQDNFESFVEGIQNHGTVLSLTKSGSDVTAAFFDNEARIRILEAEETELLDLMGQADGLSEVFSIRDRISEIRTDIERLRGQNIRTENLVQLSTVSIELREVETISPAIEEGFFTRASYTFERSLNFFISFVQALTLVLIAVAPFLLTALAIAAVVVIILRHRRKKKREQTPPLG